MISGADEMNQMIMHESMSSPLTSASTFLSTIDADIANISNDQFGLVFAGGMTVMFGGIVSVLIVGFLLENSNSYANVVADSYAQGGDEEFWSKLSPEEQVKTRELLAKIKEGKKEEATSTTSELVNNEDTNVQNETVEKKKEVSMFSDYDD